MNIEIHPNTKLEKVKLLNSDYLKCKNSGVIYYTKAKIEESYEEDYFFQDYKNQYGKSYLEDEFNLRNLAKIRLEKIKNYIKKNSNISLYEIGCAYGYFLDEAQKLGWKTKGVEVSEFASEYARKNFNLNISSNNFLEEKIENNSLDIFCAYFVLEHLEKQKSVFEKISKSLKSGGVFSFALPSTFGPLYQLNKKKWIETHPKDHFVDYNPKSLKKILSYYNLSLVKTSPVSFHPERFNIFLSKIIPNFIFVPVYKCLAEIFSYGDTFQGIAIKK